MLVLMLVHVLVLVVPVALALVPALVRAPVPVPVLVLVLVLCPLCIVLGLPFCPLFQSHVLRPLCKPGPPCELKVLVPFVLVAPAPTVRHDENAI